MIFPTSRKDAPTPTNIFVANVSVTVGELQLTRDDRSECPVWSPDGKKIAYLHFKKREGGKRRASAEAATEVVLMGADGVDRQELAAVQFGREPTLAWSPDDKTLAVGGVFPGSPVDGRGYVESAIYLIDTASRKSPELLVERGFSPSWSPDGSQVAYTCSTELRPGESKVSLCVVPAIGHSAPRVVAENAWNPIWSPSGENIAYLSGTRGRGQLLICHPDGSGTIPITQNDRNALSSYAWSPDGSRIAYTENQPMEDEVIRSGPLHTMDVTRIFVKGLNGTKIGPLGEQDRLWCHDLSWSPDGKFLAAICTRGLRDRKTHKQIFEASLFLLDSVNSSVPPRLIVEKGVERAVFSPR
jgi:Tol biopolymer transport system component